MQTMEPYSQDTIAIGNPFQRRIATKSLQKNTNEVAMNDNKCKLAEIQALTDHIAMMKCTVSQLAATKQNQEEQDEDAPCYDVGIQFGGRNAKAGK